MNARVKDLFNETQKLNAEERAKLLDLLLLSTPTVATLETERAWTEETKRRLAALDRGEVQTQPWHEVRKELQARWK